MGVQTLADPYAAYELFAGYPADPDLDFTVHYVARKQGFVSIVGLEVPITAYLNLAGQWWQDDSPPHWWEWRGWWWQCHVQIGKGQRAQIAMVEGPEAIDFFHKTIIGPHEMN